MFQSWRDQHSSFAAASMAHSHNSFSPSRNLPHWSAQHRLLRRTEVLRATAQRIGEHSRHLLYEGCSARDPRQVNLQAAGGAPQVRRPVRHKTIISRQGTHASELRAILSHRNFKYTSTNGEITDIGGSSLSPSTLIYSQRST